MHPAVPRKGARLNKSSNGVTELEHQIGSLSTKLDGA